MTEFLNLNTKNPQRPEYNLWIESNLIKNDPKLAAEVSKLGEYKENKDYFTSFKKLADNNNYLLVDCLKTLV